jgi:hypothetical protein
MSPILFRSGTNTSDFIAIAIAATAAAVATSTALTIPFWWKK